MGNLRTGLTGRARGCVYRSAQRRAAPHRKSSRGDPPATNSHRPNRRARQSASARRTEPRTQDREDQRVGRGEEGIRLPPVDSLRRSCSRTAHHCTRSAAARSRGDGEANPRNGDAKSATKRSESDPSREPARLRRRTESGRARRWNFSRWAERGQAAHKGNTTFPRRCHTAQPTFLPSKFQ
jgi:hypothetical protein